MDEAAAQVWSTLTTGVYILTTRDGGIGHGMSASWVTQVSGEPPLLAAAVGRNCYSHGRIVGHGMFGLNVVGQSSRRLQDYFHSAAARRPGNLDRVDWFWSPSGVPWLSSALLCLECRVRQQIIVGDRSLFLASVSAWRWGTPDLALTTQELPYVFVGEVRPARRWALRTAGGLQE